MIKFAIGAALLVGSILLLLKAKATDSSRLSNTMAQVAVMVILGLMVGGVALMIHAFTG